jgi:hypothetical protein
VAKKGIQPEGELTLTDFMALQDREVKHSETVDRCLIALGLDRDTTDDLISQLYSRPPLTIEPQAAESVPDAANAAAQLANANAGDTEVPK